MSPALITIAVRSVKGRVQASMVSGITQLKRHNREIPVPFGQIWMSLQYRES
jgi:hypothetical protein